MKKIMNTVYLVNEKAVVDNTASALEIKDNETEKMIHIPLHMIEKVMVYSEAELNRSTLTKLVDHGIGIYFMKQNGQLRYMVEGITRGNVLLRKMQYLKSVEENCWHLPKEMIAAKIKNESFVLKRYCRNHHSEKIWKVIENIDEIQEKIDTCSTLDELRGYEGLAAKIYFSVFGDMILSDDSQLQFHGRTRRPPENPSNALLSYAYTLLMVDCLYALECTGLDPYVGFIHGDRPGKPSLALDLMEELRPVIADRFVLRLINLNMMTKDDFEAGSEGGIYLNSSGKRIFFQEWTKYKKQEVLIPEVGKITKNQIPYLQAQKISAILRGECEQYKPVLWR